MQHGDGSRCRGMTVGAPCVERKECAQYAESQEGEREPDALLCERDVVQPGYFEDVHCRPAGTEEYAQNTDQQESRTTHQHQGQLHGCVFLASRAPYTDQQIHRDQRDFVEHEHCEQINGDEESEYSHRQECEPQEVFFGQRLQLPGSEGTGENNDGTKQQHGYRYSVDSY